MTVIVETGAGVRTANSYIDAAFVTAYLTERNRETAWAAAGATIQNASVIAATDYIEHAFGQRFKGSREFVFDYVHATGSIQLTGLPLDGETIVIGSTEFTYTFKTALTPAAYEVLIGATAAETASNLNDAITQAADQEDVTYGDGTDQNRHVTTDLVTDTITLNALAEGVAGNSTVLTSAATNVTLTALTGGLDGGSQPLSFPRLGLVDRAGVRVLGIPLKLKQAAAEYADRARVALLAPDPDVDATGASIKKKREKAGPIEEETEYVEGTHMQVVLKPYPAADRLLQDYVRSAGGAMR